MPRVPTYDGPRIAESPMPGPRRAMNASPLDHGAALAQGIEAVGQAAGSVQRYMHEERQKAEQIQLADAENQLVAHQSDLEVQAGKVKGRDAFGLPDSVLPSFDKREQELMGGLKSEEAKTAFRLRSQQRRVSLNRYLQQHMAGEGERYNAEVLDATLATGAQSAVLHRGDPERVREEQSRMADSIEGYQRRNGKDQAWYLAKRNEMLAKTHAEVIGGLIADENDQAAQSYLARYGEEMDPDARRRAGAALEISKIRDQSMAIVDQALAVPGQAYEQALAQVTKESGGDGKLRKESEERLDAMWRRREFAEAQAEENGMRDAYAQLADPNNLIGIDGVQPGLLASLKPGSQEAIRSFAQRMAKREDLPDSGPAFYALQQMAGAPETRDAFLQVNLLQHANEMSRNDLRSLMELQLQVRKASPEKRQQLTAGLISREDAVTWALSQAEIDPRPTRTENGRVVANPQAIRFRQLLDKAIVAHQQATGKEATGEEVRAMAGRLLVEEPVSEPGWLWGTTDKQVRSFDLPSAEKMAFTVQQVPPVLADQIRAGLKSRGVAASDDDVVSAYNASLGK